jgi:mutator protein MutT
MISNMTLAATAVIRQKGNNDIVLGVSRKDDHTSIGLPGGKIDDGESFYDGMLREVTEETGIYVKKASPIYFRQDGEFLVLTYLVTSWEGEIHTEEAGIVKWTTFDELKKGCFGEYNTELENHIIKYKL